jgi:heme exporter protein C
MTTEERAVSRTTHVVLSALLLATAALVCLSLWAVFLHAPEEQVMGAAQKIFYFHVPSAMVTYAGVALLLAGSLGYLWTRNLKWDNLALAGTEGALLFCTIVLITGPIWAKPAWGTWWTWEARLTTTLVLWLLLLACLMVRGYADNRDLGARLASIVGIVAALDVPIVHKAVEWWRGQHPVVFAPGEDGGLEPRMRLAFGISTLAFFLLFGLLVALRYRIAEMEDRADHAVEAAALEGGWR